MSYPTAQTAAYKMLRAELQRKSWTAAEIDEAEGKAESIFAELPNTPTTHEGDYDPRDVRDAVSKALAAIRDA